MDSRDSTATRLRAFNVISDVMYNPVWHTCKWKNKPTYIVRDLQGKKKIKQFSHFMYSYRLYSSFTFRCDADVCFVNQFPIIKRLNVFFRTRMYVPS